MKEYRCYIRDFEGKTNRTELRYASSKEALDQLKKEYWKVEAI